MSDFDHLVGITSKQLLHPYSTANKHTDRLKNLSTNIVLNENKHHDLDRGVVSTMRYIEDDMHQDERVLERTNIHFPSLDAPLMILRMLRTGAFDGSIRSWGDAAAIDEDEESEQDVNDHDDGNDNHHRNSSNSYNDDDDSDNDGVIDAGARGVGGELCPGCLRRYHRKHKYHHDLFVCTRFDNTRRHAMRKTLQTMRSSGLYTSESYLREQLGAATRSLVELQNNIIRHHNITHTATLTAVNEPLDPNTWGPIATKCTTVLPDNIRTTLNFIPDEAREEKQTALARKHPQFSPLLTREYLDIYQLATFAHNCRVHLNSPLFDSTDINKWLRENVAAHHNAKKMLAPKGSTAYRMCMFVTTAYLIKEIIINNSPR